MNKPIFSRPWRGHTLSLRQLDPDADAETLHTWVIHPKAVFWMMQDVTVSTIREAYRDIVRHPHRDAFIGLTDEQPSFLVERYDPAHVELVGLYQAEPGDIGMHFLCAPAEVPLHGFTRAVLSTIVAWLFTDSTVRRVVVEPDVRNTAVHALNAAVGFQPVGTIRKPEKQALLSVCTRDRFRDLG